MRKPIMKYYMNEDGSFNFLEVYLDKVANMNHSLDIRYDNEMDAMLLYDLDDQNCYVFPSTTRFIADSGDIEFYFDRDGVKSYGNKEKPRQ